MHTPTRVATHTGYRRPRTHAQTMKKAILENSFDQEQLFLHSDQSYLQTCKTNLCKAIVTGNSSRPHSYALQVMEKRPERGWIERESKGRGEWAAWIAQRTFLIQDPRTKDILDGLLVLMSVLSTVQDQLASGSSARSTKPPPWNGSIFYLKRPLQQPPARASPTNQNVLLRHLYQESSQSTSPSCYWVDNVQNQAMHSINSGISCKACWIATVLLTMDGSKSPPGAETPQPKKDDNNASDTEVEEHIFARLSKRVGITRKASKLQNNGALSSDEFEDVSIGTEKRERIAEN
ncbi:hypothetical protein JOM56_000708 [Amanita muscaria]